MEVPAVNKPSDTVEKEADINRKLQLYGIYHAFKNGKTPSNEQIDVALNSFLSSRALSQPSDRLSSDGQRLVGDTREVIELAKQLLLSKNDGNLIQDFIYQTTQYETGSHPHGPGAPVTKDAAKRDSDDALEGLRTLGTLLITNGQFRKLLNDAAILLRDMVGDGATNAADIIRPSEDSLRQIDDPAPDNTWYEKPDLSKDSLRSQVKGLYKGNAKKDTKDVASAATDAAVSQQPTASSSGVEPVAGAAAAKKTTKHKFDRHMDKETREKVKQKNEEFRRKATEYLKKKMPQERRDQVVFRLKKMILECQQHAEYSQAIQTLLRLAEEYASHSRNYGKGSADSAKGIRTGLSAAEYDLRTIVERFANGTSTEDLWQSISQIYKDADEDAELRGWFRETNQYIRRCLLEQGYILEDASTEEWNQLHDRGRYLLREKYRSHTNKVIDESKFIVEQFDQDPLNHAFGQSVQKLFKDLGNDESGKPAFKPHLIKDLTEVIIPAMMEDVAYIPIPRIEYTDHQFDAIIENLVLESDNFMPNILEVSSDNFYRWGRKRITGRRKNSMDVMVTGIQMDIRDVSYHISRKAGFPSISDTGVMDILLPGEGFSFRMKVSTPDKLDDHHIFRVDKVDAIMKGLKVKFKKTDHPLLFALFKPIALRAVRPVLKRVVEKVIMEQSNKADAFLYDVKLEADRAAEDARHNPDKAPVNYYQRYYDIAQQRMLQNKRMKEENAPPSDKKVNIAMTRHESIFPDIHLPGGISSKATEYRDLAAKGERWESPVFSIGHAGRSTHLPPVPRVERKPHVAGKHGHQNVNSRMPTSGDVAHASTSGQRAGEEIAAAR